MKWRRAEQLGPRPGDLGLLESRCPNSVFPQTGGLLLSLLLGIVLGPSDTPKLWPGILWRGIFGKKGASNYPVQRKAWKSSSMALVMSS